MAQQDRLFFLEDRDELWLTVKQRIAEISHSTPPLLWVTSPASEWARHGRLQDLIFISSLLKSRLSWSVTSWLKLSRQTVKQKGLWSDDWQRKHRTPSARGWSLCLFWKVQFLASDKPVFLNMVFEYSNSFVGAVKPRSTGCSSQTCTQEKRSSSPVASVCSKSLRDA